MRVVTTLAVLAAIAAPACGAAESESVPTGVESVPSEAESVAGASPPVRKITVGGFGAVLATPKRQALYFWEVEKRDFKVHCTGSCAEAWPPLYVRSASAVPKRIAGVRGTFGTIRRPDGRLQVTWNRLPIYTYAHEDPGEVRCDDVNGWFVVRV